MASARVISKTISDFKDSSFEKGDKFRYAVIVPESVLSKFNNTNEYEYVKVTPQGSETGGTLAQIITFSSEHDAEEFSTDGLYWSCIRTKLQKEIGLTVENTDEPAVTIQEVETNTIDNLRVHRDSAWENESRDITTEGLAGYISSNDMENMKELEEGDICELVNPENGARLQLPVETYYHKNRNEGTIRLNGSARKLLQVKSKDEGDNDSVRLRIPTETTPIAGFSHKIYNRIGRWFVDYSYAYFRVLSGYDRDEGRNLVRLNEDGMKRLGIEENDRVILSWRGDDLKRRNVRCQSAWEEDGALEPSESTEDSFGEDQSLSIRIPSTERDKLNISVGDVIKVRRDMQYQAGKQVALSAFGILGVIIGTNQLINMIFDTVSLAYVGTSLLSIMLLSVVTVRLIMSPIRQKCRVP
ncbi:hypothetical protein RH831_08560 [Halodesulfurarchaeum sp. HSR-GB]|uniref:hypothetical protein n=1 Tax=Halodesulfurarchaeum sp. HSR-GB TaxID=3074077 RepID=UPI00285DC5D9|nr:hypothetical protein [Halodesulfurarchaeum sp. HSR-GB]MDR5657231.1 hypothetical protein [Halodesulfurarchaeum sp. HSR-GB]